MSEIWQYLSMPLVCAAVGYGTNWLCIKMMCYPIQFVGLYPPYLGWQGIVPRRAPHIAGLQVETITQRLISIDSIFSKLDPKRISEELEPIMLNMVEDLTNEIMYLQAPKVWEATPDRIKQRIYNRARKDAPEVVNAMMHDIQNNIHDVFDAKKMVIEAFTHDRSMLVKFFQEIGYKEFAFVQNSGLWFGFLFGCVQMLVWMLLPSPWVLPIAGVFVGYATNWLALNMIFSPKNPIKLGPFTIQGLFIKRQDEVAIDMALTISKQVLNPKNITNAIIKGPSSDRFFKLVEKNIKRSMDEMMGFTKPVLSLAIGTKRVMELKSIVVDRVMDQMPTAASEIYDYTEAAMDIDREVREKMTQLTSLEFERLLRPAFEADEWKLIALGAVLGFLVGWFQLVALFGGDLF